MLRSPFVVYIATFAAALGIYQLGWSDLYPDLSFDLLFFFAVTFGCAGLLALLMQPAIEATHRYKPLILPRWTILIVLLSFAAEVWLAGGVPLLLVLGGLVFYEHEATATHLHLFMFWSVFSTIRFADFLYSGRKSCLLEAFLPVLFYGLLVYRGPALICLVSWAFVFVIKHRGLRKRHVTIGGTIAIGFLLINGLIGDLRSPGQEEVGSPSATFRGSGIPRTYFWSYLYTTVPIANLQLSVDKVEPGHGTAAEFIASEFLPDTFSKRLLPIINDSIASGSGNLISRDQLYSWDQPQIAPGLNISTIFGRAYGFFGWIGPAIMFAFLSAFVIVYLITIRTSPYRVPALALLNTLVVFCLFNNMIASAAMLPLLILIAVLPPWRARLADTAALQYR